MEVSLFATDGTKLVVFSAFWNNVNLLLDQAWWTNASTFNNGLYQVGGLPQLSQSSGYHLAMCDDGTNFSWGHSSDGIHWVLDFSQARTAFLTPTGIGFSNYLGGGTVNRHIGC